MRRRLRGGGLRRGSEEDAGGGGLRMVAEDEGSGTKTSNSSCISTLKKLCVDIFLALEKYFNTHYVLYCRLAMGEHIFLHLINSFSRNTTVYMS